MYLLFLLTFVQEPAPILFEQPYSPRIANYRIEVQYDVAQKTLHGREWLLWHNPSEVPVETLQFHLYLNGFRNSQSTFMKESNGKHRGNVIDEKGFGFSEVNAMQVAYGEVTDAKFRTWNDTVFPEDLTDVWASHQYLAPDDGNTDDRTVVEVRLPQPLAPHQQLWVSIDFTSHMPEPPFARTGVKEEYIFAGQWFPKIAVWQDGAWNCHQFHLNSEFFADYGVYDVWITLPEDRVLGATGQVVSVTQPEAGLKTHHYHAEDVHDFAWTASPDFVEFTGQAGHVAIRALIQKDHVGQGARHIKAAEDAVNYFQQHYGDYPFPNLTVVDPRRGAGGSGGMEYPTLITAGTFYGLPEGLKMVELVIIHEFGHNYWYHLLASNEFEESWLDEGINTYTEMVICKAVYGSDANVINVAGIHISNAQLQQAQYARTPDFDPMLRKSWEYYSNDSYGVNSYARPGVILMTLQGLLGDETMEKVMQTYVSRFSFKHPTSEDFIAVASEVAGQDLHWYFDPILHGRGTLDYQVRKVECEAIEAPRGFDFTYDAQDPQTWPTDKDKKKEESDKDQVYRSTVQILRKGSFVLPLEIEVTFENGEVVQEQWDGQHGWLKLVYEKPEKIKQVVLDPQGKLLIDLDPVNNRFVYEKPNRLGRGVSWLARLQGLMALVGF
ncbi:MAG: M1 family metallopeptidase [Acidobacteria bacterium]|nr:M1 family metallopeptidase [Acidobacteriota bacterium]